MMDKRAVILLSGGIDSTTTLAIAIDEGIEPYPLSFSYGQRHSRELEAAEKICRHYGISQRHKIMDLDLRIFGGSALTDERIDVPIDRKITGEEIPVTYVPARNIIFLAIASAYAETIDANYIYIGANAIDYSGYPDCRPEFIKAMETAINIGTRMGTLDRRIEIRAPIINMSKGEIIKKGMALGVPYNLTWSCYKGGKKACGRCDACKLRLKGFEEAGFKDPIEYDS